MNTAKKETDPDFGGKPAILDTNKSSMQILSELFSTFDAEPPVIVKKEKGHESKKSKKSKKKRKHKEKKHKKKSKKKKKSSNSSSDEDSEVDLAHLLIKQEKDKADEKIKIEGTSLSLDIKLEINKDDQTFKSEINTSNTSQSEKNKEEKRKQKIRIKDIQLSSISRNSRKQKHEEGEITDSDNSSKRKKHKHKDKERHTKRKSSSGDRGRHKRPKYESPERENHKSRHDYQRRERSRSRNHFYHDRHRDKYEHRARYRDRESPLRDDGFYKSRDRSRERDKSWLMREKCREYEERDRSFEDRRERDEPDSTRIDKKKLLEIARKNAIQMMKSHSLAGALNLGSKAQEKMIAAIKTGGKSIDELTDFCKSLSKKEELGELSSLSEKEDTDNDEPFHHPFKLKDRPTTITMNIKNSVPLPTKTTHERTTELRIQFPVSSGQQHRVNEEWIPVGPSHTKTAAVEAPKPKSAAPATAPLAIEAPPPVLLQPSPALIAAPPNAPPGPQVFPSVPPAGPDLSSVDLGSIVSQRLTAMRKLQENPHDVQALTEMYKSNQGMDTWAKSKQQLGQFTGSTGVQVLSQAELSSGYQAWAKKNQLQTAAPVSGGMGMHLLQKMGWKPGEGLGKEKTGTLEPLLLEVKLDKKGLVANEEQKGKKKVKAVQTVKTLQGKHPVSLLGEYASKRKLGAPEYVLEFECGPDHKKNFLFKVVLNGVEYKPNVASANKKEAKAHAATMALKQIGLLV